jgi:mannose-6-phosphate isomerase-like protein (cupin superfamily)
MASIDLQKIQQDWAQRGFSFGVWADAPGKRWEDFVHEMDELFLVVDGAVELEMKGQKLHPAPGEEVLIPAFEPHSVRNVGARGSRWLYGYKRADEHSALPN